MYNTVSQVDCEVTFNLPNSDTARSFRLMSFSQDTNYLGRGHQDSALTDTPNCGEVEVDSNDATVQNGRRILLSAPTNHIQRRTHPSQPSHPGPSFTARSLHRKCGRLEQTAERLSSSSADIGSEIRELDLAQKRGSSSSASNSFKLRNGAFAPRATTYHGSTYDVEGDEEQMEKGEVDEDDEADLLPPPITQLGDRSQKRSSGRVTMPSSRLQGYEVY
ncbi:hypothetical protein N7505_007556 [Penicillium chrysogenum]|uniref:Uncharacterized protein n=1 Tax=Penicillium chrysogenum TaxID=5076 RepID=A0ABQ8WF30_PENCH|nr:hypothetical protein N7505_007556 [Penicillium chrysogenum]